MKYNAKYFINKFEKIPEEKWTIGDYEDRTDTIIKYCALGHCGNIGDGHFTPEAQALQDLVKEKLEVSVAYVNDAVLGVGEILTSEQLKMIKDLGDTPKERILNALLMIDAGILEEFTNN